jgi:hypothetical protein
MVQYPFSKEFWWLFSQEKGFSNLTPIGDESIRAWWVSFRDKCTNSSWKDAEMRAITGMRQLYVAGAKQ